MPFVDHLMLNRKASLTSQRDLRPLLRHTRAIFQQGKEIENSFALIILQYNLTVPITSLLRLHTRQIVHAPCRIKYIRSMNN